MCFVEIEAVDERKISDDGDVEMAEESQTSSARASKKSTRIILVDQPALDMYSFLHIGSIYLFTNLRGQDIFVNNPELTTTVFFSTSKRSGSSGSKLFTPKHFEIPPHIEVSPESCMSSQSTQSQDERNTKRRKLNDKPTASQSSQVSSKFRDLDWSQLSFSQSQQLNSETDYAPEDSDNTRDIVSYKGIITKVMIDAVFEVDKKFLVLAAHYSYELYFSDGVGLRVGAKVHIHNAHALFSQLGDLIGFGCCTFTNIEIHELSQLSIMPAPFDKPNSRLIKFYNCLKMYDIAYLMKALQQFLKKFKKLISTKQLIGSSIEKTDNWGFLPQLLGLRVGQRLPRSIHNEFFDHRLCALSRDEKPRKHFPGIADLHDLEEIAAEFQCYPSFEWSHITLPSSRLPRDWSLVGIISTDSLTGHLVLQDEISATSPSSRGELHETDFEFNRLMGLETYQIWINATDPNPQRDGSQMESLGGLRIEDIGKLVVIKSFTIVKEAFARHEFDKYRSARKKIVYLNFDVRDMDIICPIEAPQFCIGLGASLNSGPIRGKKSDRKQIVIMIVSRKSRKYHKRSKGFEFFVEARVFGPHSVKEGFDNHTTQARIHFKPPAIKWYSLLHQGGFYLVDKAQRGKSRIKELQVFSVDEFSNIKDVTQKCTGDLQSENGAEQGINWQSVRNICPLVREKYCPPSKILNVRDLLVVNGNFSGTETPRKVPGVSGTSGTETPTSGSSKNRSLPPTTPARVPPLTPIPSARGHSRGTPAHGFTPAPAFTPAPSFTPASSLLKTPTSSSSSGQRSGGFSFTFKKPGRQKRVLPDRISFRCVIVEKEFRMSNDPKASLLTEVYLKVRDVDEPHTIEVYISFDSRSPLICLIPGATVIFYRVGRKVAAKSSNIYVVTTHETDIVVTKGPQSDHRISIQSQRSLENLSTRQLHEFHEMYSDTIEQTIARIRCFVHRIWRVELTWKCVSCDMPAQSNQCPSVCSSPKFDLDISITCAIDDGSAQATLRATGASALSLLALKKSGLNELKEFTRISGSFRYNYIPYGNREREMQAMRQGDPKQAKLFTMILETRHPYRYVVYCKKRTSKRIIPPTPRIVKLEILGDKDDIEIPPVFQNDTSNQNISFTSEQVKISGNWHTVYSCEKILMIAEHVKCLKSKRDITTETQKCIGELKALPDFEEMRRKSVRQNAEEKSEAGDAPNSKMDIEDHSYDVAMVDASNASQDTSSSTTTVHKTSEAKDEGIDEEPSYPNTQLWGLDPLFYCVVRLFIKDLLVLPQFPDLDGTFRLHDHPIREAEIVGIIVGIKQREKNIEYFVDDGTGVLVCTHWMEFAATSGFYVAESEWKRGDLVRVRGRLNRYLDIVSINVQSSSKLDVLTYPEEEYLFWLESMILSCKAYNRPSSIQTRLSSLPNNSVKRILPTRLKLLKEKMIRIFKKYLETNSRDTFQFKDILEIPELVTLWDGEHKTWTEQDRDENKNNNKSLDLSSKNCRLQLCQSLIQTLLKSGSIFLRNRENDQYQLLNAEKHIAPKLLQIIRQLEGESGVRFNVLSAELKKQPEMNCISKKTVGDGLGVLIERSEIYKGDDSKGEVVFKTAGML